MTSPHAGRQLPVRPDVPTTKWDLMTPAQRESVDNAPSGCPVCLTCGADISTEGLFARHYVLPDLRFWNLGHCPTFTTREA